MIRTLGRRLSDNLPFPVDHHRNDAVHYEHYREAAITRLISYGLSSTRAHCVVDDCIAVVENLLHRRAGATLDG